MPFKCCVSQCKENYKGGLHIIVCLVFIKMNASSRNGYMQLREINMYHT